MLPFTDADLSSQDKELSMAWDDSEVPTDFFGQFVMSDGQESISTGGESDTFSQFCPSGVSITTPGSTGIAPHSITYSIHGDEAMAEDEQGISYAGSIASHPSQQLQYPHHLGLQSGSLHKPPGGAPSISDTELLRLDGLTMRSPRAVVPAIAPSAPSSPPLKPEDSPKKTSRFDSIYSTIRRATGRKPRPRLPRTDSGNSRSLSTSPVKIEQGLDLPEAHPQPPSSHSHPLTSTGPVEGLPKTDPDDTMGFVNGYLDDPFCMPDPSGLPSSAGLMGGGSGPAGNTPLGEPQNWMYGNAMLGHSAAPQAGGCMAWTTNAAFASHTAHAPLPNGTMDPRFGNWWHSLTPRGQPTFDPATAAAAYQTEGAKNATMNLVMQLDNSGMGYEYGLSNGLVPGGLTDGGKAIQMPQPRHPAPATLLNGGGGGGFALDGQTYLPPPGSDPSQHMHLHHQQPFPHAIPGHSAHEQPPPASYRRPKPRAPSSGARYHHTGPLTSPRKIRERSTSSSSPSPTQPHSASAGTQRPSRAATRSASRQRGTHRRASSSHAAVLGSAGGAGSGAGGAGSAGIPPLPLGPGPANAVKKRRSWSHARRTSSMMSLSVLGASASASASTTALGDGPVKTETPTTPRRASDGDDDDGPGGPTFASGCRSLGRPRGRGRGRGRLDESDDGGGGGGLGIISSCSEAAGVGVAAGGGGGGIGFVNFTPEDHSILMAGVAPSGSSKTKARREREAAERQRRLNEAVIKAVAASGGDLVGLRERLAMGV